MNNVTAVVNENSVTVSRTQADPGDWLSVTLTKLDSGDFCIDKVLQR